MLDIKKSGDVVTGYEVSDRVLRVAAAFASGLRRAMARHGIRQMIEFVNGMVFAGVLVEKSYGHGSGSQDEERFVDVFAATAGPARQSLLEGAFAEDLAAVREQRIGLTDLPPYDMLATAALSAQATVTRIAGEEGFDRTEALQVVCIGIVAARMAQDKLGALEVEQLIGEVTSKVDVFEEVAMTLLDQLGPEGLLEL